MSTMLRASIIALSIALIYMGTTLSATSSGLYTINITCPDGWQKAMNNCYLFNLRDQLTWAEARTECAIHNADLMVIGSREELNWINIQTEEYHTDEWWVGLEHRTDWQWVQYGGDTTLINWRNEPDNYDGQNCDAISEYGLFSDEFCASQLGFICKYPIQRGEFCPTTSGWFMTDTACYYISDLLNTSQHLSWQDAKTYCAGMVAGKNMQLMSFTDQDDALSFQKLLASFDPSKILLPWWTGLNDQQTEGTYRWQDGTLANGSFITWDKAPSTDRSQQRNCGVMYQGGTIDDVTCDKRAHYVCQMSAIQGHLNLGCGSWMRGGQSCYWFSKGAERTWNQAKDTCSRANAHLLKVDNLDEKAWLESLLLGAIGFWTGLNQPANGGPWVWDDLSPLQSEFIQWSQEPNNANGNEDCAEIKRDGTYNDRLCQAKIGYACEYVAPIGGSCMPGWTPCEASCLYISPAGDNNTVTWYEAGQRCNDLVASGDLSGFRLAVNDRKEQACVNQTLANLPPGDPGHWTELNDLDIKYYWQYVSAANNPPNNDVIPWAREPNNFNNSEHCAVMYEGGSYNDLNCQANAYFICERELGGSSQAIKQTAGLVLAFVFLTTLISKY